MAYILAGILLVAWFAGLATSNMLGGFIHLLLLFSIMTIIANLVYQETRS